MAWNAGMGRTVGEVSETSPQPAETPKAAPNLRSVGMGYGFGAGLRQGQAFGPRRDGAGGEVRAFGSEETGLGPTGGRAFGPREGERAFGPP